MSGQKQFFRIEGGAVHLVTERIERTVTLDDLLAEVGRKQGVITPILPTGCRLFQQVGDRSVFVIEQVPQVRHLTWIGMQAGNAWKLAFPYVVFIVVLRGEAVATGECKVFYRKSPLGNGDEGLLRTNLCNVYQDGRICTGNFRVAGTTTAQKAEGFVSGFWGSAFNADLSDYNFRPAARSIPQVSSLAEWQKASEENPLFVLSASWLPFEGGTLADVAGRG